MIYVQTCFLIIIAYALLCHDPALSPAPVASLACHHSTSAPTLIPRFCPRDLFWLSASVRSILTCSTPNRGQDPQV